MREAAANGDAAEAAKKLKDQAKKIAERAKQEKASNADKDKPKNNSGNSTP